MRAFTFFMICGLVSLASLCRASDGLEIVPDGFKEMCLNEYRAKAKWDENPGSLVAWNDYQKKMDDRINEGHKLGIYFCPREIIKGIIHLRFGADEAHSVPLPRSGPVEAKGVSETSPQVSQKPAENSPEQEDFNKLCREEYQAKAKCGFNPPPELWQDYQEKMSRRIAEGHRIKTYFCPVSVIRGIIPLDFELREVGDAPLPVKKPSGLALRAPERDFEAEKKKKESSFMKLFKRRGSH